MADGALIATTRNADLQALGTGGQVAVQAWDQIASYLRRACGPAHAALFAEPNPDPDRGVIDWYAENPGPTAPLAGLPPAEADAARATLQRLLTDIETETANLRRSSRESDRFMAELLAVAVQIPGPEVVYVQGGQPILVAWAHASAAGNAQPAMLVGEARRSVAQGPMAIVGPPAQEVVRRTTPWAGVGALLLLLPLLLGFLWWDPLGWFNAPMPVCVAREGDMAILQELRIEQDREARLRDEIARHARDLGDRRVACPPPQRAQATPPAPPPTPPAQRTERPPVTPPATPPQPPPNRDAERAREQGARSGRVQIILAWDNENDLDLAVICPDGSRIYYDARTGCGGGELDIDQNARPPFRPAGNAVENIVWDGEPPPGSYRIGVMHSGNPRGTPQASAFRVTLRIEGKPDRVFNGRVAPSAASEVGTFEMPAR